MRDYLTWASLAILAAVILTGYAGGSAPFCDARGLGPALSGFRSPAAPGPDRDDILYIGRDDPYEIVTITGTYFHNNYIVIENHGRLELVDATVTLQGDIVIEDDGALFVSNTELTFSQLYGHEFGLLAGDRADVVIENSIISGQGEIIKGVLAGEASARIQAADFADGMTVSLMESSAMSLSETSGFIEAIVSDEAALDAADSPTVMLLIWLALPAGAAGAFSLPPWGPVDALAFPGDFPGVTGIDYTVSIVNTETVIFSLLSLAGSDVTISDSFILAVGLLFTEGDSHGLFGLTYYSEFGDFTLPLGDRGLRLVNTQLWSWNVYAAGTSEVTVLESTVGEIFSMDNAAAIVQSSTCDGNGGYVSAQGYSTLIVIDSIIIPKVVALGFSATTIAESELNGEIFVSEVSALAVVNPVGSYVATPLDAGVLIEGAVDPPPEPYVGGNLSITGTADIRPGPDSPITYAGYELQYGRGSGPSTFTPIGSYHTEAVHEGELEVWDTEKLSPGYYTLRLLIHFEERLEPAEVLREVRLELPSELQALIDALALLGLAGCLMSGEEPPPAPHEEGGGGSGGCGCAFYRASAGSAIASSAVVYLLPVLFIGVLKKRVRRKSL